MYPSEILVGKWFFDKVLFHKFWPTTSSI